ncbi:MAG: hypothetical protein VX246_03640 [Myxococcota bacterium]|nr:hypothetical protein [Myxococcota bacterium]
MTTPTDVELGHVLVGLIQPHTGYEHRFHRWYERDHLYRAGKAAPGTIGASLWVAPPDLRTLREPSGANAISGSAEAGSHLSTFFIQQDQLDEQQAWVAERMEEQRKAGELFPHRDHLYTHRYRLTTAIRRDADGVPPELALDRNYRGIAATWIARAGAQSLEELESTLRDVALPAFVADSPVELSIVLGLLPKPDSWPDSIPAPEGLGDRLLVLHFFDADPREVWQDLLASLQRHLQFHAAGSLLFASPFDANVPGRDPEF